MKITICGSIKFTKELVEVYYKLQELGHTSLMHKYMFRIADGTAKELTEAISKDHAKVKRQHGFIKWWHNCIMQSDAILVCNYDKNGIKNYIGGNTFLEIGFAHVNDKIVYLLNLVPKDVPYVEEIEAMFDFILHGNLTKISNEDVG